MAEAARRTLAEGNPVQLFVGGDQAPEGALQGTVATSDDDSDRVVVLVESEVTAGVLRPMSRVTLFCRDERVEEDWLVVEYASGLDSERTNLKTTIVLEPQSRHEPRGDSRQFWRLPVTLPLDCRPVALPERYERDVLLRRRTLDAWREEFGGDASGGFPFQTLNIGGGGVAFHSDKRFVVGSTVFTTVQVRDCGELDVAARVVRCIPLPKGGRFVVALEFIALSPECSSKLARVLYRNTSCR